MALGDAAPFAVDVEVADGRTVVTVRGTRDVAVVVGSASGEEIYLPPEEFDRPPGASQDPAARRETTAAESGATDSAATESSTDGDGAPAESPYDGPPADDPYGGPSAEGPYRGPAGEPADDGAPADSPYAGPPADSPYEGLPSDDDGRRAGSDAEGRSRPAESIGVTTTAEGVRIVHPEPVHDLRVLRAPDGERPAGEPSGDASGADQSTSSS